MMSAAQNAHSSHQFWRQSPDCGRGLKQCPLRNCAEYCVVLLQYRYGVGTGAFGALTIPLVAAFCCGALSVASNSR